MCLIDKIANSWIMCKNRGYLMRALLGWVGRWGHLTIHLIFVGFVNLLIITIDSQMCVEVHTQLIQLLISAVSYQRYETSDKLSSYLCWCMHGHCNFRDSLEHSISVLCTWSRGPSGSQYMFINLVVTPASNVDPFVALLLFSSHERTSNVQSTKI